MIESATISIITIVGAIPITAFITWFIAQKQIMARHITMERAKWRARIRKQALKAHDAILKREEKTIRRLQNEFRALLNPFDCCDNKILKCMTTRGRPEKNAEEFSKQISLLLKHDWERAKLEIGFHPVAWLTKMEPKRLCFTNNSDRDGECLSCVNTFKGRNNRYKKNLCNLRFVFAIIITLTLMVIIFLCWGKGIWSVLWSLCTGCT